MAFSGEPGPVGPAGKTAEGGRTVPEIKLLVSCHQMAAVPELPFLCPIQVGAALSPERFPGFLYDDAGENISAQNRSYCELTAQYWA